MLEKKSAPGPSYILTKYVGHEPHLFKSGQKHVHEYPHTSAVTYGSFNSLSSFLYALNHSSPYNLFLSSEEQKNTKQVKVTVVLVFLFLGHIPNIGEGKALNMFCSH